MFEDECSPRHRETETLHTSFLSKAIAQSNPMMQISVCLLYFYSHLRIAEDDIAGSPLLYFTLTTVL